MSNILVGNNLRLIRKSMLYTQLEFADMFGVSRATYAAYESGRNMPDHKFLGKVSNKLSISLDYIVNKQISSIDYDSDKERYLIQTADDPNNVIHIARKGSPMEGLSQSLFGVLEGVPDGEDITENLLTRVQLLEIQNEQLKLEMRILTKKYEQLVQALQAVIKFK